MELQSITGTILQEAKESAELIIKDAKELAKAILEKQRQLGMREAKAISSSRLKKTTNEANAEQLRKIAQAKISSNWIVQFRKEEIIAGVIDETKKRLHKLSQTQKYISVLEKLIIEAGIILGGNKLEVVLNAQDSKLPLKLNKLAKKISAITKTETKLKLSKEKIQTIGGAMLKTSDGKVIMDNTFEDILNQREKSLKAKISKILFN